MSVCFGGGGGGGYTWPVNTNEYRSSKCYFLFHIKGFWGGWLWKGSEARGMSQAVPWLVYLSSVKCLFKVLLTLERRTSSVQINEALSGSHKCTLLWLLCVCLCLSLCLYVLKKRKTFCLILYVEKNKIYEVCQLKQ